MVHKRHATETSQPNFIRGGAQTSPKPASVAAPQTNFAVAVLGMSWQLAFVVLVPIIGGHWIDERYHLTPLLTLLGLAVAAIGVFGVLIKTVKDANAQTRSSEPTERPAK